jgi:ankyrin repeat protein
MSMPKILRSSALHVAAEARNEKALIALLEKRAEIEARDFKGLAPLHIAIKAGYYSAAKLLLNQGANMDAKDLSRNLAIPER